MFDLFRAYRKDHSAVHRKLRDLKQPDLSKAHDLGSKIEMLAKHNARKALLVREHNLYRLALAGCKGDKERYGRLRDELRAAMPSDEDFLMDERLRFHSYAAHVFVSASNIPLKDQPYQEALLKIRLIDAALAYSR